MAKKYLALNIASDITKCYGEQINIEYQGNSIVCVNGIEDQNELEYIESLISKLDRYKGKLEEFYGLKKRKKVSSMLSIKLSHIYVMYDENNGYYKIGRSINPKFREKTLQAEAPKVTALFVSPLTYAANEQVLHREFAQKRIRGEWFSLCSSDIDYIKSYDYGTP